MILARRADLDDQRGRACQPGESRMRAMMATLSVPIAAARTYARVARTDSLVRNSLFMMTSTAATGIARLRVLDRRRPRLQ